MGWLDVGVSLVSTGLDLWNSSKQSDAADDYGRDAAAATKAAAEANANISRYDASVAEKTAASIKFRTEEEIRQQLETVDLVLSKQRTGYSKRGVVASTGTALDVQVETFKKGMQDLQMIKYNGKTAEQEAKSLAERYRMLADAGLRDSAAQASLIESAWSQRADNIQTSGWANFAVGVNDFGTQMGWW